MPVRRGRKTGVDEVVMTLLSLAVIAVSLRVFFGGRVNCFFPPVKAPPF